MLRIAPPIMLAQLIQAMYNIIDSLFVGQYSDDGLTALSAIYPVQLIIIALAVGTGVGTNTLMAKQYALKDEKGANHTAGVGTVLAVIMWALISVISIAFMGPYVAISAQSPVAMQYANEYGMIVSIGSIGLFLEGNWTKVLQSEGNMKLPMIAQIVGAVTNIVLDPLLIFTAGLGIKGAAIATVIGQITAAVIVGVKGARKPPEIKRIPCIAKSIYKLGYPSICMQALYTVYIAILNIILAGFCDEAVTVLGLYYKLQSFFFIPLLGLQTCIVPVLSYNYTSGDYLRCRRIFRSSLIISGVFMILGVLSFELIPTQLIGLFTQSETVKKHRRGWIPPDRSQLYSCCIFVYDAGFLSIYRLFKDQYIPFRITSAYLSCAVILDILFYRTGLRLACIPSDRGNYRIYRYGNVLLRNKAFLIFTRNMKQQAPFRLRTGLVLRFVYQKLNVSCGFVNDDRVAVAFLK